MDSKDAYACMIPYLYSRSVMSSVKVFSKYQVSSVKTEYRSATRGEQHAGSRNPCPPNIVGFKLNVEKYPSKASGLEHFIEITVASSHSKHLILQVHAVTAVRVSVKSAKRIANSPPELFIKRSNQCLWAISSSLGVGGGEGGCGTKTSLLHGTRP